MKKRRKITWDDIEFFIQNAIVAIIVVGFSAAIGWFAASRYTMQTLEVWYQPEFQEIGVQDYLGNIEWHIFDDGSETIAAQK